MAEFVKFSVPEDLKARQSGLLEKIRKSGKVRVGSNEATKAIERGVAKLVVIAEDVTPPEIVMHLPLICREKGIPFSYISTKKGLGQAVGIEVGTAAIAVIDEGETKKDFADFTRKLAEVTK
ncbi:MAG TPA: 50S ribosomal protein L7ae [Candidatus Diapherotrites archaeon]|uniref:Large ribosomal subunit protein eL8 n=1 Tax=Candidatus Iainarchaeum sp. TaxID=3101447 RepID=A0A7J4IY26_9ARCH|nr:50S ribosomal protein L7ae [Candidatus Diapherotrites archaeon]